MSIQSHAAEWQEAEQDRAGAYSGPAWERWIEATDAYRDKVDAILSQWDEEYYGLEAWRDLGGEA